ncbi:hypothetical protein BLNAU_23889 [Blattamonas nauphoetae]|uniref:Secreted protein n=1 Tax=Blattamonas nauphoetae TaxID=2049346 RepID=A0ABQ9WR11_9EUKA|nr:hypothetical protein BLNAU_23889 [Blattamonas nauphoetae]
MLIFSFFYLSLPARHPHSAQHFLLPTSLPSAEKSSVLPPITGCEEKNQHICILVDQAPLPHVFTPLSPNLAFPLPSELFRRQFPQQLTGQTHESSFRSRLCRAEVSERCPCVSLNLSHSFFSSYFFSRLG